MLKSLSKVFALEGWGGGGYPFFAQSKNARSFAGRSIASCFVSGFATGTPGGKLLLLFELRPHTSIVLQDRVILCNKWIGTGSV